MKPYFVKTPKIIDWVYPNFLWRIKTTDKKIFLTFDDGPTPKITPWALEQLQKYNAKATFFCVGNRLQKHPEIAAQLLTNGHKIGNHTFNHEHGRLTDADVYIQSVIETQKVLVQYGVEEKIFRPPYGRITAQKAKMLRQLGYKFVMWTVLSADFDRKISAEMCYKNVTDNTSYGSIIVFHDSEKAFPLLKATLPKILEYYHNKGYEFCRL
ncbi:MAG: polysaccharide deacetylase family protein [Flavobacteriales bacterium]|nr:MAG: polysaccharide deacetylase family protein [Flavobacteriales bacterium]